MDLNALKLLVEIVDGGNLSVAARRLNTTRSNVSHRLKAFERAVGAQLLRRSTRRIEPTQVGYALYEHGSRIVREIAAANAAIATLGKSLHGHLRVSVPTALGQLYLGPLLLEFAREHPQITLEVVFNNRVFDLMASEIDVALRITSDPPEQYVARELARIGLVLCASPEYVRAKGIPRDPEDLTRHAFVARSAPNGNRMAIKLKRNGKQWEIGVLAQIQSENFLFLKSAALAGIGLAVLPFYAARDEIARKKLIVLLPSYTVDMQSDKLFMITAPNRYPTVATRALIEFMKSSVEPLSLLPGP